MDGASRFTQRDAVASILITGINIVAGFLIGVLQHGMDLAPGAANVHGSYDRRRPCNSHSGADDLHLGWFDRDPCEFRREAGVGFLKSSCSAIPSRFCWPAAS